MLSPTHVLILGAEEGAEFEGVDELCPTLSDILWPSCTPSAT